MGRNLRLQYEGALYHVSSRGNGQQDIFLDDRDRQLFLKILGKVIQECAWICHSYCLMNNHYHLLVGTPRANLARGMLELNGSYAKVFNLRHSRTGHVLGGRYGAKLIEDDTYLLVVARYIALNPVGAFLIDDPSEWKWSSYNAYCGTSRDEDFLTTEFLLSYFGSRELPPAQAFSRYVIEGIEASRSSNKKPPLSKILPVGAQRRDREKAICIAFLEYDYSQREIAAYLGVHHTTVGRIIRRQVENAPLVPGTIGAF